MTLCSPKTFVINVLLSKSDALMYSVDDDDIYLKFIQHLLGMYRASLAFDERGACQASIEYALNINRHLHSVSVR